MTKHARFFLLPSFILISAALIAGCNDKGEEKAHVGEPQVTVHIVKTAPLEVKTELPGRTNAYRIAEVRPQVSGIVLNRNFTEGSDVQAGQSLYQIDPATYQANYDSAKGELAKSEAAAAIAHLTVKRYVPLVGTKYISQQEYDQAIADARQADAAVIAAKATVESARINLAYTKVTAPISGRIGKSTVTEGALVTNGQTTELATVQQLDPIYVDVTQSSNDFMRLKQSVEQGNLHKENATSNVELVMENGQTYPLVCLICVYTAPAVQKTSQRSLLSPWVFNPDFQLRRVVSDLFKPVLLREFYSSYTRKGKQCQSILKSLVQLQKSTPQLTFQKRLSTFM